MPDPLSLILGPVAARLLRFEGVDFTSPAGEPAIVSPDSVSWRVFSNPVSVYIGGIAAVILEFGEPRVRSGVWEHSSFSRNPGERMRRTGAAAMLTVYGARSRFEALAAQVNDVHRLIEGVTPDGEPYRASDPELLRWVQATASFAFLAAYTAFVRPIDPAARSRYFREATVGAPLYGVLDAPGSEAELHELFEASAPRLQPSPIITEFLEIMRRAPILPLPLRPVQRLATRAAIDVVPPQLRARLGLDEKQQLSAPQRALVRAMARAADRLNLPSSPWAQASVRLGLPADYLRRRAATPPASSARLRS